MNDQDICTSQFQIALPNAATPSLLSRIPRGLLAGLGVSFLLVATSAQAATAPDLATSATYGILSNTYTNTAAGTTVTGIRLDLQ